LSSGKGFKWPNTLQYARWTIKPINLAVSSLVIASFASFISTSESGGAA